MKAKRLVPVVAGLLILSGCATTQSPTAENRGSSYYDQHYVGAINSIAHKSGTRVIWINPPRASTQEDSGG